jgi:Sec-independent protein translocase protein TatA
MPDLSFLPLMGVEALIIVGVVALFFVFSKFLYPLISAHRLKVEEIKASARKGVLSEDISARLKSLEDTLSKDAEARKERQEALDKKLNDMGKTIRKNTVQSCVAVMYNNEAPPLEIFEAAITYFKLFGNGNGKVRVVKVIMWDKGQNKELWQSALNKDRQEEIQKNRPKGELLYDPYFVGVVEWIDKQIA